MAIRLTYLSSNKKPAWWKSKAKVPKAIQHNFDGHAAGFRKWNYCHIAINM